MSKRKIRCSFNGLESLDPTDGDFDGISTHTLGSQTTTTTTGSTTTVVNVTSATGFKVGLGITVGTEAREITAISSNAITVNPALTSAPSTGTSVTLSPYNSIDKYWTIQDGANVTSDAAGIRIDSFASWDKAVFNADIEIEYGGTTNGATAILLGANTSDNVKNSGDATDGYALYLNRVSSTDNKLYWLFRSNSIATPAYLNTGITAYNGASIGNSIVTGGQFLTPVTDDRVLLQVICTSRYVYFLVNGIHYFTVDLPDAWLTELRNYGPRIAIAGEAGTSRQILLYGISVGTPDPLALRPDNLIRELPPLPTTTGIYRVQRATDGSVSWHSGTIATAEISDDAITGAKVADDAIDSEHITGWCY